MDIYCPNCGEPWSAYHLQNDEPCEWDLPPFMRDEFIKEGSQFHGPDDPVRMAAEKEGWKFASKSVLSIVRCPACKEHEKHGGTLPDADHRQALVAVMADILGDDPDGLASELSDMGLHDL